MVRACSRGCKLATGRDAADLAFGRTAALPFVASTARARALAAWKRAKLQPITLHEARHSTASYMVAAGLNDLEPAAMIGHSDPRTTTTIYAHLFDESAEEVRAKADAYGDRDRLRVRPRNGSDPR
jgi:integrase